MTNCFYNVATNCLAKLASLHFNDSTPVFHLQFRASSFCLPFIIHHTRAPRCFFLITMWKFIIFSYAFSGALSNDDGPASASWAGNYARCEFLSRRAVQFIGAIIDFPSRTKPQLDIQEIHHANCGRKTKHNKTVEMQLADVCASR